MPPRAYPKDSPSEVPVEAPTVLEPAVASPVPQRARNGSWGRVQTVDLGLFNQRKPVVVGIDQSLVNFGLAAYSPEDDTAFIWLYQPGEYGVRRLMNIHSFVLQTMQQIVLRCGTPLHVCMEGYSFGSFAGREKMGECGATVKMALISALGIVHEIAYPTIVAPQPLKKFATGRGNAKKNEVMKAVFKKWGLDVSDDNMAEAYTLARVAAALVAGDSDLAYEREVVGALERHTEWDIQSKPKRRTKSSMRAKSPSSE